MQHDLKLVHDSDCAVNNEPAFPAGPCDCGAEARAQRRFARMMGQIFYKKAARCKNALRLKLVRGFCRSKTAASKGLFLNAYLLLFGNHERQAFLRWCSRVSRIQRLYPDRRS